MLFGLIPNPDNAKSFADLNFPYPDHMQDIADYTGKHFGVDVYMHNVTFAHQAHRWSELGGLTEKAYLAILGTFV